jgi:putative MATE family efflux protein
VEKSQELGTAKIPALLARFSIPAIIGMLVQALYNIVDRIFIGQGVGPLGIAGATIAFPLMLIQMAFGMLVGLGATSLISISLGEGKKDKAEAVLGNAFILLVAIATVLSVSGLLFLDSLLRLFGASETVLPYARSYTSIILFGTVFQAISMGMNNFIRGEGEPRVAMATMLIGAVLNTILDPLFIFVFKMGVAGAAWATVISLAVSAAWVMAYYLGGKSQLKIRLKNLRPRKEIVLPAIAIGSAPCAMQLAASLLNAIVNNQLTAYGGDLAVSAMGILFSIAMLFFMPIFGINQGAQPIIGYNYGAKSYDRMVHAVRLAVGAATVVVLIGFTAIQLFPRPMIALFAGSSQDLIETTVHAIRRYFLMLPVIGFQIIAAGYFQAVGKPKQAMFLTLSRQVLVLIPLLLILPPIFGLDGVWFAPPIADLLSALLTGAFFVRELRSFGKPA